VEEMKRYLFPLADGRFLEVKQNKIDNALPYIERRLEWFLPVECVEKDEIKKVINYIRVNVNRDCRKEEVNGLVAQIKNLLLETLDHMTTYELHRWQEYKYDDMEGEEECLKSEKEIVQTASGTIRPVRSLTVKK
jgi:hypothetical protein